MSPEPGLENGYLADHARLLIRSHRRLTGRDLIQPGPQMARALYVAPFVVLSHSRDDDPVFTYANLAAQRLFAMAWDEIVGMPSRYSAEAPAREERQRLLERVAAHGYIDDYQGIRIARSGERFLIRRATVWSLQDESGAVVGQAAAFGEWTPLGPA